MIISRNFVRESKKMIMNAIQIKEEIHDFIDHADERFLRLVYSMIESEKAEKGIFITTNEEMINRAEKSLCSIENGKTRNIHEFQKDVESWKERRAIK